MAEKINWKDNVGQIFLSNDEDCFWIFPTDFFCNEKLCITSPWFSYEDETWRIVKRPARLNDGYVTFYVWRKVRRTTLSYNYTFGLELRSLRYLIGSASSTIESDFGAEFREFCQLSDLIWDEVSRFGLMKLFFKIHKTEPSSLQSAQSITTPLEEDHVGSESEECEKAEEPKVKGIKRLAENLKHLLLNGENSDVVLEADNREFRGHKAILAARSPVFASMFQHDMVEKKSGVVDIPDCTAESFDAFLLYLYTGSADTMSPNNVFNLYYAADKYRVEDLKEECVDYMMDTLSVETVCDVISLSLRHEETKLRKKATSFFRENLKGIIKTVQWQKFMTENPIVANELLIKALNA